MVPPTDSGNCHSPITHYALQCSTEKRREEKRTFFCSKGKCASIIQQNYYSVLCMIVETQQDRVYTQNSSTQQSTAQSTQK